MFANRRRLGLEILESRRVLSGGTVSVSIPDDLTGQPGGQVVAPVNIDDAAGIRGAEIHINYDATLLDADDASVTAGSVWPQETQVVANVDDLTGSIVVFVSTAEELGSGGGSLLDIQFAIRSDASVGGSTAVDLAEVRLNEGAIVPNPEPIPGPDSTDGLITFVSPGDTASISGVVYADTNSNNQPDLYEGIPGVKVVLVNTDNGQQWETFTEDEGSYEFRDLAAGSYMIQEQHPAAFLDGSPNEISADLTDGQSLTDQNFQERGLRPEYVYNRLFTTTALPVGSANWISAIRRIVTDAGGLTVAQVLTITVENVNEAPTDLALSNTTVDENVDVGTTVGVLTTTDTNASDTHTYSLVAGEGDTDNASFTIVDGQLQTAAALDFETQSSHSVRVRTTDQGGLNFEKALTINVNDVNETPTALAISNATVEEGQAIGTAVGSFTTTDVDSGDTFAYSLVSGDGDTGNASFAIVDDQLQTAAVLDRATTPSYTIRIKSTDAGGLSVEQTFTIEVTTTNNTPVAVADAYAVDEDGTLVVDAESGVLVNDTDADDDPLSASLVSDVAHGTLSLNGDGSFTYWPDADFFGTDSFTYVAMDGTESSDETTVTITINAVDDPVLVNDDGYTATSSTLLEVTAAQGVLANDTDVDGDSLVVALGTTTAHGTLALSEDGSFTYLPDTDFVGTDTFTYSVNDGTADYGPATATIVVGLANLVQYRLEVTTPDGTPVTTVTEGDDFLLSVYVQDQRDVPEGVFAGYLDIGLDSTLVSRNGTIVFGENYPNGHTFDVTDPDLINEIGAFAGFTPLGGGESLLVTIPMHADAAGTAVFDADFADEVPNESLLYGDDVGIPVEQIVMVDAALQIVAGSGELPDANL